MPVAAVINAAAEAEGITRWAVVFALAEPADKLVLLTSEESRAETQSAVEKRKSENEPALKIEIVTLEGKLTPDGILNEVHRNAVTLLIIGKNRRPGVSEASLRLSRFLFDRAPCTTVMEPLGTSLAGECDSVLIPSAGGLNSREALRLGSRLANQGKGCISRDRNAGGTIISGTVQANRPVPDSVAADLARFAKVKLGRSRVEVRLRTEIVARGISKESKPSQDTGVQE